MKCLLIGIAISACISVWSGSEPTRLTELDRNLTQSTTSTR